MSTTIRERSRIVQALAQLFVVGCLLFYKVRFIFTYPVHGTEMHLFHKAL